MDESSRPPRRNGRWLLVGGDAACLAFVTGLGFAWHQEVEAVASTRFLATFLPFLAAWLLTAGGLGALEPERAADARQLWRPVVAVLVATPIGAALRSLWLGTTPMPVFIVVIGGVSLLALGAWRTAYCVLQRDRLV